MALDEMPVAPAMTSASLLPQPSAKPKASPAPTLRHEVEAGRGEEQATTAGQVVERELHAEVEEEEDQAEGGEELEVLGAVEQHRARPCAGRRGSRRP